MQLAIVFPMFWGRESQKIYKAGDQFYDHPTAIDDEGTIPPLFESMQILEDREFEIIAIAGANNPEYESRVEDAAHALLTEHAGKADVRLHLFSYSHLARLHDFLRREGADEDRKTH